MLELGFWLWVVGSLLATVGWVWLVVVGFQVRWQWGVAVFLVPLSATLFVLIYYRRTKGPFLVALVGCLTFAASIGLRCYEFQRIDEIRLGTHLLSANRDLAVDDLKRFWPGRAQDELLRDVGWHGDFLMACGQKGRPIAAIEYAVLSDSADGEQGEVVWAIFVDKGFVKFVRCKSDEIVYVPVKLSDCSWLVRQLEREGVTATGLAKEVESMPAMEQNTDAVTKLVLAIVWVGLSGAVHSASVEEYRKNAALRDQFNAARLRIGMTQAEVKAVLKGAPLESGQMSGGIYEIYGSEESFKMISPALHFSNVLVVFQDGKVCVIHRVRAGDGWRAALASKFLDLPKRPAGAP